MVFLPKCSSICTHGTARYVQHLHFKRHCLHKFKKLRSNCMYLMCTFRMYVNCSICIGAARRVVPPFLESLSEKNKLTCFIFSLVFSSTWHYFFLTDELTRKSTKWQHSSSRVIHIHTYVHTYVWCKHLHDCDLVTSPSFFQPSCSASLIEEASGGLSCMQRYRNSF
jgi:hypothetical protein